MNLEAITPLYQTLQRYAGWLDRARPSVALRADVNTLGTAIADGREIVYLCLDESGHAVARGLVNFDSNELPGLLGRSTRELGRTLGPEYERELVHRDDLVLLRR